MLRRVCGSKLPRHLIGRYIKTVVDEEIHAVSVAGRKEMGLSVAATWQQGRGIYTSLLHARRDDDDDDDNRRIKMKDLVEELQQSNDFDGSKARGFLDSFFQDDQQEVAADSGIEEDIESNEEDHHAKEEDDEEEDTLSYREDVVLRELKGLRRGSRRVVLQKLLQGGILQADPMAGEELKKIEQSFRPPPGFRMKVVHINRTCKGTRSGGLFRFSAMVVVGNGEGVLGWGYGKSVEVAQAVQKAQQSAYRNLYPIPRHNGHTIPEEVTAAFGKTKIIMYPKSSGRGIVANPMLASICQLAGIYDIGIKVHGSRNPQNTIKCLFAAFDALKSEDDIVGYRDGILTIPVLTGRFGKLHI